MNSHKKAVFESCASFTAIKKKKNCVKARDEIEMAGEVKKSGRTE